MTISWITCPNLQEKKNGETPLTKINKQENGGGGSRKWILLKISEKESSATYFPPNMFSCGYRFYTSIFS